ncbi:MAG: class I SAM-dependent methyltransferase [Sphingobacteriales bacterium]|nr:class I SAM-dependent methyltransferase [Sphingobacteriales bacterium]
MSQQHYRQQLYEDYHRTQVARHQGNSDLEQLLANDMRQFNAELAALLPASQQEAYILDIGCGFGSLLLFLQQRGYTQLSGIDISAEQVQVAQSLGLSQVLCTDAIQFLAEKKQLYDCIFCIDVIEHLEKSEALSLLQQIRHSLKVGGSAIFRTPNLDAPFASVYAFGDYTHETLLNGNSAEQLMLAAGFSEVRLLPSAVVHGSFLRSVAATLIRGVTNIKRRIQMFAHGYSSRHVLFSPNLLIVVKP